MGSDVFNPMRHPLQMNAGDDEGQAFPVRALRPGLLYQLSAD